MSKDSATLRPRIGLALLATAVILAALLFGERGGEPDTPLIDDPDSDKLSIAWVSPQARPGQAVIAHVEGLEDAGEVTAKVSVSGDKRSARVLRRDAERVVVRLPRDLPSGPIKLRVYQHGEKSKPRLMQIRTIPLRDMAREALGGLAVLLVGLTMVGRAFGDFAGRRLRERMGAMTRATPRAVGLGALVGGMTQSTTMSAGVLLGMLRARLLPARAAAVVLLGVQLGAATAGAILPLFAIREALWVVVLGAIWTGVARDRQARALGHILLGCGLLFLGLQLMQEGFRPLLSDPTLLPLLDDLGRKRSVALVASVSLGALLAGLLQGPGPAFAVVLGLTQSTGLLSLHDGLTILSGAALGSTLGTIAIGWPAGQGGRRLAVSHFLIGASVSLVALLGVPLWTLLAERLVAGDPAAVSPGAHVLRPAMAAHLSAGFVLSQLGGALVVLPLLPWLGRIAARVAPTSRAVAFAGDRDLVAVLGACRAAIVSLGEVLESRDRAPAVAAEHAIAEARSMVGALMSTAGPREPPDADEVATATMCLHLATSIDGALRVAERALARDLTTDARGREHLATVHGLLVEGIEALVAHAQGRAELELGDVQQREIRLNKLEADARSPSGEGEELTDQLWVSELLAACEAIGNHLYRLANALSSQRFSPRGLRQSDAP
ncbi:MAG: Na/Pi symporter [Myxococcales bacterium]